ncbi:MAG: transposase, partial [Deltaproteobacteria bacterium]|nr:transposase [Deltaproteobacteria bacterium]
MTDQVVTLAGKEARKDYPEEPWGVSYWIHENKGNRRVSRKVRLFTNDFKLSTSMIANIYKSRWQIEAFFKLIWQNLKIKSFLGTSHDAVKTQVYVAPSRPHPEASA